MRRKTWCRVDGQALRVLVTRLQTCCTRESVRRNLMSRWQIEDFSFSSFFSFCEMNYRKCCKTDPENNEAQPSTFLGQ